jgi:hypothetical protein
MMKYTGSAVFCLCLATISTIIVLVLPGVSLANPKGGGSLSGTVSGAGNGPALADLPPLKTADLRVTIGLD